MKINEFKLIETICDNSDSEILNFLKELDNWMADASFTEKLILDLIDNIKENLNVDRKRELFNTIGKELDFSKDY